MNLAGLTEATNYNPDNFIIKKFDTTYDRGTARRSPLIYNFPIDKNRFIEGSLGLQKKINPPIMR